MRRKQRLKAWQEKQALAKSQESAKNFELTKDDYLEKPMDVDTDFTGVNHH